MRSRIAGLLGFVCTVIALAGTSPAMGQIAFRAEESTSVDAATSISIVRPTDTLEFDTMVAAVAVRGGTGTTITPPAGWTLILRTDNGMTLSVATYQRLAGSAGADPGPYVFDFSASVRATGTINAYGNVHGTTPIDVSLGNTGSSASVVAPSVNTTVANTRLVAVFSRSDGNATFSQPAGMTERNDESSGAGPNGAAAATDDEAIAAIGATGTRTSTSSNGAFAAQSIALMPSLCGNGTIDAGEQCDDGNTTAGDCCSPICQFEATGTECRESAGACDPAETCTGSSATCPADLLSPNGTACGDPTDSDCTNPDTCDGVSVDCQPNDEPAATSCGDPSATECTSPDTCDGNGACLDNDASAGTACGDPSATECTNPDTCDGGGACLANHAGAGTACGDPSDTECTNPDTCNGGGGCQANDQPNGTACGDPTDTDCANPDTCSAGACQPNDELAGTACGDPSDTDCTNPDTCNATGSCLANDEASGVACGDPADTDCSNPDTCNGTGTCQANDEADGVACGDATDTVCSNPDTCAAGVCAPNHEPAGTSCRPVAGTCDVAETCDGSSPTCPADGVLTAGTPCRPASGACDAEEQCDGTLATCPADLFAPDGTTCDDGQACTTADACSAGLCQGEPDAEGCADDFLCYKSITSGFVPIPGVDLADAFESRPFIAKKVMHLCSPADEGGEGIADATTHLTSYGIKLPKGDPKHVPQTGLVMRNQFGDISVDTIKPDLLFVPSATDPTNPPTAPTEESHNVNHYKCYKAKVTKGTTKFPAGVQVTVADEFTATKTLDVKRPKHLCVPVDTEGVPIKNADVHLMCYLAKPASGQPAHVKQTNLQTADQLGSRAIGTIREMELCVPSLRLP